MSFFQEVVEPLAVGTIIESPIDPRIPQSSGYLSSELAHWITVGGLHARDPRDWDQEDFPMECIALPGKKAGDGK